MWSDAERPGGISGPSEEGQVSTPMENRARRAAKRAGLVAKKAGRWRANSIDNRGGFQILNAQNLVVAGEKFDLTPEQVIEFCQSRAA
jgi:hypothetical protein